MYFSNSVTVPVCTAEVGEQPSEVELLGCGERSECAVGDGDERVGLEVCQGAEEAARTGSRERPLRTG